MTSHFIFIYFIKETKSALFDRLMIPITLLPKRNENFRFALLCGWNVCDLNCSDQAGRGGWWDVVAYSSFFRSTGRAPILHDGGSLDVPLTRWGVNVGTWDGGIFVLMTSLSLFIVDRVSVLRYDAQKSYVFRTQFFKIWWRFDGEYANFFPQVELKFTCCIWGTTPSWRRAPSHVERTIQHVLWYTLREHVPSSSPYAIVSVALAKTQMGFMSTLEVDVDHLRWLSNQELGCFYRWNHSQVIRYRNQNLTVPVFRGMVVLCSSYTSRDQR